MCGLNSANHRPKIGAEYIKSGLHQTSHRIADIRNLRIGRIGPTLVRSGLPLKV